MSLSKCMVALVGTASVEMGTWSLSETLGKTEIGRMVGIVGIEATVEVGLEATMGVTGVMGTAIANASSCLRRPSSASDRVCC